MGDVFELPIVRAIREIDEIANIIKEKEKRSEDFKKELEQLKRKCIRYNLNVGDFYYKRTSTKPGWG